MPKLEGMLDELHGSQVFSKINLKSSYYQISKPKEAYLNGCLCHLGFKCPQYFHEVNESSI